MNWYSLDLTSIIKICIEIKLKCVYILNSFLLNLISRCSPAFFAEERQALENKRQKIRLLQQRKSSELEPNELKDLPEEVPMPLVIGTKVSGEKSQSHQS